MVDGAAHRGPGAPPAGGGGEGLLWRSSPGSWLCPPRPGAPPAGWGGSLTPTRRTFPVASRRWGRRRGGKGQLHWVSWVEVLHRPGGGRQSVAPGLAMRTHGPTLLPELLGTNQRGAVRSVPGSSFPSSLSLAWLLR